IEVKDFAAGEFIGSLATAAGVNLNNDIKNALEGIGQFDLAISQDEFSLKSSEQFTIDLLEIASIDTPVDAINDAINNAVKDVLGDTKIIFKPELGYSFTDKKLTLATEIGEGENPDRVSLQFGKDSDVKLEYKIGEDLSLGSLVSLDELQDVSFEDLTFIAANYTDKELKEFVEGFNFSGEFNFKEGNDIVSEFFRDELKILKLDADLQVGDQVNIAANAETNWNLIGEGKGDFTVTLSQIGLDLKIDGATPEIGIDGTLKLKDYDPSQANEPELLLMGGLSVEPSSLNAQFALDTGSNQAWTNPFGLKGVALRDFGIQAGIGPSGLDNLGIRGDLKYGTIDIDTAFNVDLTDPDKIALVLTLNEPVSLVQLISGPVNPFIFGEGASDNVLTDTFEFLDDIIDIQADSLKDEDDKDGDGDREEKLPLIQFVPFEGVEIAGKTLEEGFGINAKVTAWGAEAELQLGAETDFSKFEGSLSLKNIDFGFLKIAGADANDDELNLDLVIDTKDINNSSFSGDGRLEILGKDIAKVDFNITPSRFELKDFDLDLGVVELDVNDLIVDIENTAASGYGQLKIFDKDVATVNFDITPSRFELQKFNLDLGVIELDVNDLIVDIQAGDASGSASLEILGYEVANARINIDDNQFLVEGKLDLFNIIAIDNAKIDVQGSDDIEIGGTLKLFGQELANSSITIKDDVFTFNGGISLDIPLFGELGANLTIISDGTLTGSTISGTSSLGDFEFSLEKLSSIGDLIESIADELGLGGVFETFNELANIGAEVFNDITDLASNASQFAVNLAENTWNSIKGYFNNFVQSIGNTLDNIFGDGLNDGNNKKSGGDGNDRFDGQGGDDDLYGHGGNDTLLGGDGNDRLHGWTGRDWLEGGNGNDQLLGQGDNDSLYGHGGDDNLQGHEGNDRLHGDDGNDLLEGGSGSDTLYGASPDFPSESGDDYLIGGDDDDYLYGQRGSDKLEGGNGNDLLDGGDGNDELRGGNQNDRLDGGDGNDLLDGGDGNDTLYSGSGNDTLIGGDGDDRLIVDSNSGENVLAGGDGNDYLEGHNGKDVFSGGSGNDTVKAYSGNDFIDGGDGDDSLDGMSGNDLIKGGEGADSLFGKDGNDLLDGGASNDVMYGGDGDDILKPGQGSDTIDGGNGSDILVLSGTKDNYTITETSTGKEITDKRDNSKKIVTGVELITYEQKQDGSAANGPLANATAFIDTNGNFQLDEGETQTTTDTNGEYSLPYDIEELDSNRDGQLDGAEAQVVVVGGIDTTTGLPGTIPLISQMSATGESITTTPLTTLKAVLSGQGIEAEQVETLLNRISGFSLASLSQPLDNFDPYAAVGESDTSGIDIASGHIKIMNLFINGTSFLEAAGYQEADAQIQVIIGIGEVLQTVNSFDLSQTNDLQTLLTQLSQQLNLSVNSEVIAAVSELVAESNLLVDELVEDALSHSVSDVLPTINPIKQAVYSQLPEVTAQLVEGEITPSEAQTQLQDLLNSDTFLVEYALNENRTVTVTASNTATIDDNITSETSPKGDGNTNTTVTEGENSNGQFIISLGEAAPAQGLKILYTLSGTATLGQDYESENGQFGEIIVAPGETEAVIDLTMLDDDIAERPESITINLRYVGDGFVLDPMAQSAVLDITDNDEAIANNTETGSSQTGTFGDDSLIGEMGEDEISGHYGDDMVFGQAGNDDLMGAAGKDIVFGGKGNDNIEGNFGADVLHGNKGDDIIAGGADNDIIEGHEGSDQLHGDSGDDYLQGNEGNDVIKGGNGNDFLKGNQDNDWLIGGSGNDILMGGQGVDLFNGGEGADVFFFNVAAEGGDLILDFDPTQGDKIQVFETGFNTTSLEDFSFVAGTLYFQDEELALIQNNGQTYNHFADLSEIVEIVSEPTRPEVENVAVLSANITPRVPDINLVDNPETTILDEIIQRGQITVATSDLGSAFDLEFARTLAAALFGDASKVETVNTSFDEAVSFVADGSVDLAARRSTLTLGRDAALDIDFSPTYFYDYQAIVVRNDSGIDSILDLNGRTIGVLEGTTALENLYSQLGTEGIEFTPQQFSTAEELIAAYDQGLIDAYSSDRTLILDHLDSLPDSANHRLLEVEFSKEPISLALPENDSQWADVVRWVNYVPVQAEEFGIDSQNIYSLIEANTDENENNDSAPEIRRFLGLEGNLGEALGLENDFAVQVIQQVGNSAEIHQRHFPELDRNQNLLWTDGGLLYSPPFSGSEIDGETIDNDNRNLLAEVLERGAVKLGLAGPANNPGFAVQQDDGEYVGFDVDLGRAIAAAIFGDASKLEIQTQSFTDSFANTANGVVDVSAMGITHNLVRDASLGIDYSPTYLYTGQGILVKMGSGIDMLPSLNGRRIGVLEGATALQNLQDSVGELGGTFTPVTYSSNDELFSAYEAGDIDAVSTDMTILSARIPTLSNPEEHQLLDDVLSKEPLALITDENQSEWADIVRWVTHTLVQAEEYGITSENIDQIIANNTDDIADNDVSSALRQFLGLEGNIGESLGLSNDFAVNIIKAVGNYGEIYNRHFDSDLLRRGSNELAANFGLQSSPPFSGTGDTNIIAGTPEDDNLEGGNLSEQIFGYQGSDLIVAQDGSDLVYGGQGNDTVQAGNGNDYVWGNAGNDWLNGNPGNDRINGGDGDDELYGGQGDDLLVGGMGNNTVTGGVGEDQFVLTSGLSSNIITDFTDGEDMIVLEEGLTFEQLTIEPTANATVVKLGEQVLATLNGVDVSLVTADDFNSTLV
ncbi:MAG: transporter substrate-binding domain-containing protein, partial [Microcoleaceae cyanobacterium]